MVVDVVVEQLRSHTVCTHTEQPLDSETGIGCDNILMLLIHLGVLPFYGDAASCRICYCYCA